MSLEQKIREIFEKEKQSLNVLSDSATETAMLLTFGRVERKVLAVVNDYAGELAELLKDYEDEEFFNSIFGVKLTDFKDLKMRFYKLQGWLIDFGNKFEKKVAELTEGAALSRMEAKL